MTYTKEDHATWAALFARQRKIVSKVACKEYLVGFKKLALDSQQVPDIENISRRVSNLSGWKLANAKNKSLSMKDWFIAMRERSFPVTDYIRQPGNLDYTRMPDLFHEYFGHLPFFTSKEFAAMAHEFGSFCKHANKRQLTQIGRIWSLGVEFGLIKEKGKIKLLGAGLLSSYGECKPALVMIKDKKKIVPFTLVEVIKTPGKTYQYHEKFFVLNSVKQISEALRAYAKKESLSATIR